MHQHGRVSPTRQIFSKTVNGAAEITVQESPNESPSAYMESPVPRDVISALKTIPLNKNSTERQGEEMSGYKEGDVMADHVAVVGPSEFTN